MVDLCLQASKARGADGVAGLVGPTLHEDALAAELQHLRHEGKTVERSVLIERRKDLALGLDLDHITRAQGRGIGVRNSRSHEAVLSIVEAAFQSLRWRAWNRNEPKASASILRSSKAVGCSRKA